MQVSDPAPFRGSSHNTTYQWDLLPTVATSHIVNRIRHKNANVSHKLKNINFVQVFIDYSWNIQIHYLDTEDTLVNHRHGHNLSPRMQSLHFGIHYYKEDKKKKKLTSRTKSP